MSKRKTSDKSNLNEPRSKRQKLSNGRNTNNKNQNKNGNNSKETICSSRICNDEIENKQSILNAHCYDDDDNDNNNKDEEMNEKTPSMIEIKKHNMFSEMNNNSLNNAYSKIECDKLCGKINQRLKIYWNEDKQWYYGTIKDYKPSTNESLIVYDDNESEWLNLTKSGHETVEFLYDESKNNNNEKDIEIINNKNVIDIGNKITSGKVLQTFNNGCIANINIKLDNRNNSNLTAIAFDNKYINYILNNNINNTNDIFKLLHLCQFDKTLKYNNKYESPRRRRARNRNSNKNLIDIEMKNNNDIQQENNNNNTDMPPWILIGCTIEKDDVIKLDNESHLNLIHSNENKYNKPKRYNGYNNSTITYNGKKNKQNMYNSSIWKNNNKITKKCNNKNIIDLKAIYPLEKIRLQNHNKKRTVIVIGAGISGLSCSRELMNFGYNVIVLEARNRAGGRILTDYTLGLDMNHGCDVGGGWIHGVERNPLTRLVERLKLTLHSTSGTIQMFDHKGHKVDENLDEKVEKEFNGLLDRISKENEQRYNRIHGDDSSSNNNKYVRELHSNSKYSGNDKSLGETLNEYLNEKKKKKKMTAEELNLWNWHFSNLEYSNAADLNNLSLTDWDQDDEYAFNGDHCLIQEGYGRIINGLKQGINVKYKNIVTKIDWTKNKIVVYTKSNDDEEDEINATPESMISNSNSNSSMSVGDKPKGKNVMVNDSINIDYDGAEGLSRIDISKVDSDNENDTEQADDSVPIYAMLPKSKDSYQFVKLKDVKGQCHYDDDTSMEQNGHNDEDIDMENEDEQEEDDDEDGLMEYTADAVVVTLPLGILKNGDVEFKPKLPTWKQNAIDGIGYGLLNKVFLKFEKVFWDINNDYVGYASSNRGEFYLFVNLVPVSGTPVLMSLVSGSFAAKLEEKSDVEIVNYSLKILQNIFCDKKSHSKNKNKMKKIPQPVEYYVTKWGQDRFAKGSYSYIAKGANGDHYDKLSYSVKDKVYFAGEATIRKWPASVHGAYLSGIREARKIMNNHYIHNEEEQQRNIKQRRGKRKRTNSTNSENKLTTHLIKAGLTEFPTDTIFKPIKDITIRMSTRRNNANKYSSKNQYKKKQKIDNKRRKNSKKTIKNKRVRRQHENEDEDEDISSMSDTSSSITSSADDDDNQNEDELDNKYDEDLICTLCGGNGYLSDDIIISSNKRHKGIKKKNKNEKLIGPFVVNNSNNNTNNKDKEGDNKIYIHYGCGQWSPDIHNQDNVWYNVISCIKRSKYIRCCYCNEYGATVHCHNKYCLSSYHPECAHTTQYWDFNRPDEGQLFFCIKHRENMLALHVNGHKTKISELKQNMKNKLRQPRPPSIRK